MQQVRWFVRVLDKWNVEKNRFKQVCRWLSTCFRPACDTLTQVWDQVCSQVCSWLECGFKAICCWRQYLVIRVRVRHEVWFVSAVLSVLLRVREEIAGIEFRKIHTTAILADIQTGLIRQRITQHMQMLHLIDFWLCRIPCDPATMSAKSVYHVVCVMPRSSVAYRNFILSCPWNDDYFIFCLNIKQW